MDFSEITLRQELSSRGGGIEIDLTSLGYESERMTAYQNYLGGGILGRIANDCTVYQWRKDEYLVEIAYQLAQYMFNLTNNDEDFDFEFNQRLAVSAY